VGSTPGNDNTMFVDNAPPGGNVLYEVRAQDSNGRNSVPARLSLRRSGDAATIQPPATI